MDELKHKISNGSLEGYNFVATAIVNDVIMTELPTKGQATTKIFGTGSKIRLIYL